MRKCAKSFICLFVSFCIIACCSCQIKDNVPSQQEDAKDLSPYSLVLSKFEDVVNGILSTSFEFDFNNGKFSSPDPSLEYEWSSMIIDATKGLPYPSVASFGYILNDINNDGIPELFLVREDYTLLAIFTADLENSQLLKAFWSQYKGVVLDSGEIYTFSSGTAQDFEYAIYRLETNEKKLVVTKQFGCEQGVYYEIVDNTSVVIEKARFDQLLLIYPFQSGHEWSKMLISPVNQRQSANTEDGSVC